MSSACIVTNDLIVANSPLSRVNIFCISKHAEFLRTTADRSLAEAGHRGAGGERQAQNSYVPHTGVNQQEVQELNPKAESAADVSWHSSTAAEGRSSISCRNAELTPGGSRDPGPVTDTVLPCLELLARRSL